MCYFVTLVVGGTGDLESLNAVASKVAWPFEPQQNPHLLERLPSGTRPHWIEKCHCNCGTVVGSAASLADQPDRRIERLRKRGWSESRIKRREAEMEISAPARQHAAELVKWTALIRALCTEPPFGVAGLLLHNYSGLYDDESFDIEISGPHPISELTDEGLRFLKQDVCLLYRGDSTYL